MLRNPPTHNLNTHLIHSLKNMSYQNSDVESQALLHTPVESTTNKKPRGFLKTIAVVVILAVVSFTAYSAGARSATASSPIAFARGRGRGGTTGGSVAAAPAVTEQNHACDSVCDYNICASEADVCKNECNECAICYGFDPSKMCAAPEVVDMGQPAAGPVVDMNMPATGPVVDMNMPAAGPVVDMNMPAAGPGVGGTTGGSVAAGGPIAFARRGGTTGGSVAAAPEVVNPTWGGMM